jgi:hypothetical protein
MMTKTNRSDSFTISEKKIGMIVGAVSLVAAVWGGGAAWEHVGSSIREIDAKYDAKHKEAMNKIDTSERNQKEFRDNVTKRLDSLDTKFDLLAAGMYRLEGAAGTRPNVPLSDYVRPATSR